MSAQHIPGPWVDAGDDEMEGVPFITIETNQPTGPLCRGICEVSATYDDRRDRFVITDEDRATARLIVVAPDHALIGWATFVRDGKWEELYNSADESDGRGEFCFAGLRHATQLDEFGFPKLTNALRAAITRALAATPSSEHNMGAS